jgi:hypothetical protein
LGGLLVASVRVVGHGWLARVGVGLLHHRHGRGGGHGAQTGVAHSHHLALQHHDDPEDNDRMRWDQNDGRKQWRVENRNRNGGGCLHG